MVMGLPLPSRMLLSIKGLTQCMDNNYALNDRSRGKQFSNWFPEGPDIKCFVLYLDFCFKGNKRITGANQNKRLGLITTQI